MPLLPEVMGSLTLANGSAPVETKLAVLNYLVNEALSATVSREHLDALSEQADMVKRELREHQTAAKQAKKEEMERERLKAEQAAAAAAADAAAAESGGDGGDEEAKVEPPPAEVDPLAGMREALLEMQEAETASMSRAELMIHNKLIKSREEELRREEAALDARLKKEESAARRAQIEQRKKLLGFFERLDKLQTRVKPIGLDRCVPSPPPLLPPPPLLLLLPLLLLQVLLLLPVLLRPSPRCGWFLAAFAAAASHEVGC